MLNPKKISLPTYDFTGVHPLSPNAIDITPKDELEENNIPTELSALLLKASLDYQSLSKEIQSNIAADWTSYFVRCIVDIESGRPIAPDFTRFVMIPESDSALVKRIQAGIKQTLNTGNFPQPLKILKATQVSTIVQGTFLGTISEKFIKDRVAEIESVIREHQFCNLPMINALMNYNVQLAAQNPIKPFIQALYDQIQNEPNYKIARHLEATDNDWATCVASKIEEFERLTNEDRCEFQKFDWDRHHSNTLVTLPVKHGAFKAFELKSGRFTRYLIAIDDTQKEKRIKVSRNSNFSILKPPHTGPAHLNPESESRI